MAVLPLNVTITTTPMTHQWWRCPLDGTIPNGRSVVAMVVDECDSTMGCDSDHDYQPPCRNNIVDASRAVWKALGVPHGQWGGLDITWTDD